MIKSAKDVSMNAFMALKNNDKEKDVKWIQNFLSESLVEDIPWECSKALIILKEGYQAIIPREASRSILLGKFTGLSKLLFELRCLCTFPSLSVFVRLSAKKNFLMDADIKKC